MFLTTDDYKRIEQFLSSKYNTLDKYKEAKPIEGNDSFLVNQDGQFVKCTFRQLRNSLNTNSDFINATDSYGAHNLEIAASYVPVRQRKKGLVLTVQIDDVWKIYQYVGEELCQEQWVSKKNWTDVLASAIKGVIADEEDLTTVDYGPNYVSKRIKFKDKLYTLGEGEGRVYLRRHIEEVNGEPINVLTQNLVEAPNTRYIVQYDYDLKGETIQLPENCTLDFQGGSFNNGYLVSNDTVVMGKMRGDAFFGAFYDTNGKVKNCLVDTTADANTSLDIVLCSPHIKKYPKINNVSYALRAHLGSVVTKDYYIVFYAASDLGTNSKGEYTATTSNNALYDVYDKSGNLLKCGVLKNAGHANTAVLRVESNGEMIYLTTNKDSNIITPVVRIPITSLLIHNVIDVSNKNYIAIPNPVIDKEALTIIASDKDFLYLVGGEGIQFYKFEQNSWQLYKTKPWNIREKISTYNKNVPIQYVYQGGIVKNGILYLAIFVNESNEGAYSNAICAYDMASEKVIAISFINDSNYTEIEDLNLYDDCIYASITANYTLNNGAVAIVKINNNNSLKTSMPIKKPVSKAFPILREGWLSAVSSGVTTKYIDNTYKGYPLGSKNHPYKSFTEAIHYLGDIGVGMPVYIKYINNLVNKVYEGNFNINFPYGGSIDFNSESSAKGSTVIKNAIIIIRNNSSKIRIVNGIFDNCKFDIYNSLVDFISCDFYRSGEDLISGLYLNIKQPYLSFINADNSNVNITECNFHGFKYLEAPLEGLVNMDSALYATNNTTATLSNINRPRTITLPDSREIKLNNYCDFYLDTLVRVGTLTNVTLTDLIPTSKILALENWVMLPATKTYGWSVDNYTLDRSFMNTVTYIAGETEMLSVINHFNTKDRVFEVYTDNSHGRPIELTSEVIKEDKINEVVTVDRKGGYTHFPSGVQFFYYNTKFQHCTWYGPRIHKVLSKDEETYKNAPYNMYYLGNMVDEHGFTVHRRYSARNPEDYIFYEYKGIWDDNESDEVNLSKNKVVTYYGRKGGETFYSILNNKFLIVYGESNKFLDVYGNKWDAPRSGGLSERPKILDVTGGFIYFDKDNKDFYYVSEYWVLQEGLKVKKKEYVNISEILKNLIKAELENNETNNS